MNERILGPRLVNSLKSKFYVIFITLNKYQIFDDEAMPSKIKAMGYSVKQLYVVKYSIPR